jgi:hypothetical protein
VCYFLSSRLFHNIGPDEKQVPICNADGSQLLYRWEQLKLKKSMIQDVFSLPSGMRPFLDSLVKAHTLNYEDYKEKYKNHREEMEKSWKYYQDSPSTPFTFRPFYIDEKYNPPSWKDSGISERIGALKLYPDSASQEFLYSISCIQHFMKRKSLKQWEEYTQEGVKIGLFSEYYLTKAIESLASIAEHIRPFIHTIEPHIWQGKWMAISRDQLYSCWERCVLAVSQVLIERLSGLEEKTPDLIKILDTYGQISAIDIDKAEQYYDEFVGEVQKLHTLV